MCGIIGVAGSLKVEHDKIFKQLLIVDSLRGTDSTGMCLVPMGGAEERVVKAIGNPFDFLESPQFTRAFACMAAVLMGHNRYATQGKVNKINAHPFEMDKLIGMHNGTLTHKYELLDARHFDVDSENLYHHMNELGLKSLMEVIRGAWSLVWWDKEAAELNFLRNDERPMHIAYFNEGKTIAWASEEKMLELVLDRNGVKDYRIVETEVNLHYRFPVNHKGELDKPIVAKCAPKHENVKQVWVNGNFTGHVGANQGQASTQKTQQQQRGVVVPLKNVKEEPSQKKSIASQVLRGYAASRSIKLELVDYGIDDNGSRFIHCYDEAHPYLQIRLYVKGMEYKDDLGKYIRCDIKDVNVRNPKDIYYKVAQNSVNVLPADPIPFVEQVLKDIADDSPPFEIMYQSHRGKDMTFDDWQQQYGCCAACDGYVDPSKKHKFTFSGEALCDVCVDDPQVMSSIATM